MNHGPGRQEGRDGVVLVVAVALGAALMFAFHAAAGRLLDPGDYSGLGALVSVLAVLGVPLTAVQIAVARETAAVSSAPLDAIRGVMTPAAVAAMASGRRALLGASIGATAVGATGVVASPLVAAYLHLPDAVPVVVACGWVALNGPAAVARGLLIGARRPRPVAGAIVVTGLGRLAAVAVLAPVFGLAGAVGASVAAEAVGCAVLVAACGRTGLVGRGGRRVRVRRDDTGRAVRLQLLLWGGAAAAPVLGRRLLVDGDPGSFAAMATAAGACFFLPQAVATLALPRFVTDGSWKALRQALAVALGVAALGAAAALVAPRTLFAVAFGDGYVPDRGVLALLCLAATGHGALAVLVQHAVARRLPGAAVVAAGVAGAVVATELLAGGPASLAAILLVGSWPAVVVLGARARRAGHRVADAAAASSVAAGSTAHRPVPGPGPVARTA